MMAVFMIVTLAAIAVYLLTMSTGQLEAVTQDEQATRAYQAARAGVDWGAYQLLRNTGSTFATNCAALPANGTYSQPPLPLAQGLAGFYAEVKCQAAGAETEGSITVHVYRLIVTGCNGTPCGTATPTYVERQLQLTLTQCIPSSSYLPNSC